VTEAFIAGFHPGDFFYFTPNPNLQPEVGHNTEVGLNVKYDGVFVTEDKIRAKVNAFNNDVSNDIDLQEVFSPTSTGAPPSACPPTPFGYSDCYQYVNIGKARIQGVEMEFNYDAGRWFAGVSGRSFAERISMTASRWRPSRPTRSASCSVPARRIANGPAPCAGPRWLRNR
jgi:hemoglobin/transferrin/lactoferrin receptor protein